MFIELANQGLSHSRGTKEQFKAFKDSFKDCRDNGEVIRLIHYTAKQLEAKAISIPKSSSVKSIKLEIVITFIQIAVKCQDKELRGILQLPGDPRTAALFLYIAMAEVVNDYVANM